MDEWLTEHIQQSEEIFPIILGKLFARCLRFLNITFTLSLNLSHSDEDCVNVLSKMAAIFMFY